TEVVAVVEKAPLVKTTKANITETFELETVEALPHASRDVIHSPVINDVAGGMNGRVRGGTTAQTLFTQDGFEMRGQFPTLKAMAAYEVNTGGFGVDNPMAAGGSVNLVTKSGSNRYEFEFNATMDSNRLRFFRDERDNPRPTYFYVFNPMVSGPIVKDKLWFHFNLEWLFTREEREPDPLGEFPDLPTFYYTVPKGTVKFTWQINSRNKLSLVNNYDSPHEVNDATLGPIPPPAGAPVGPNNGRVPAVGTAPEAHRHRHAFRDMTGLIWESLLTDSMVLRSQLGFIMVPNHIYPKICDQGQADVCDHIAAQGTVLPRQQVWGNAREHLRHDFFSWQAQNALEYFLETKSAGSHSLKLKSHFLIEQDIRRFSTPGNTFEEFNQSSEGLKPLQLTTYYSNDPRREPARYGWFITTSNNARHTLTLSDSWKVTRFLTLIPALSHVYASGSNSSGDNVKINMQAFAPSISVAWDATHDGRTAVRGSYNQYVDLNLFDVARHSISTQVQRRCQWDEASQSYSRDCEFAGGRGTATYGSPCGPTGVDEQGRNCTQSLKVPRAYEYTAGIEREIASGVAVSFDVVYKHFERQYETRETNRIWNNSGTALAVTGGYRNGRPEQVRDLSTPDDARRVYKGATVGIQNREGRLRTKGSYTLSSLVGNVFEGLNSPWGDIPPQDVYMWGPLADDHRHELKLQATYSINPWLSTGFRYRYFSGTPYNRLYHNTVDNTFNSYRARVGTNAGADINDPADDRQLRLPDIQDFNVQVRASMMPLLGKALDFYVDVLNVLGLRTPTAISQEDRTFGTVTGRMEPFRIRLGLNYKY
ncbi:MAG TPA: hypothetical protein VGF45_00595, partial [Polyangia bacterium]